MTDKLYQYFFQNYLSKNPVFQEVPTPVTHKYEIIFSPNYPESDSVIMKSPTVLPINTRTTLKQKQYVACQLI
ncbi:hypothetical protein pb186bvf_017734 [Paramecium bursaria]